MGFNINTFINTALPLDGLRPNLFEIQFYVAPSPIPQDFTLKAKATAMPSSIVAVTPVMYYGRQVKLAGNRQFENWPVTVIMDEDDYTLGIGIRGQLIDWMNKLNYHQRNFRDAGYVPPRVGGYFGEASIYHMMKDSSGPTNVATMIGCWPTEVGPINLDWADNDRVAEFQVTFAYQWWEDFAVIPS